MSKKRPSVKPEMAGAQAAGSSKMEAEYWRTRLFKSTYKYRGRRKRVRHWSVKIQYQSRRKTFSLASSDPTRAAAEACQIYQKIFKHTWDALPDKSSGGDQVAVDDVWEGITKDQAYWQQRLIQRDYTMSFESKSSPELSVRIAHAGSSYYVPLGTADREAAADRALQLAQTIAREGWESFNRRHRREMTVAFRWLDSPLAWTYTTIHTQASPVRMGVADGDFGVMLVEADIGVRNALETCINRMEGFHCAGAFANAQQALWEVMRNPPRLILVSQSFAEKSGAILLSELKAAAPQVAGLLYSVYEDSEELFKTTPGGAGTYLLQRSGPTQFLQPVVDLLKRGAFSNEEMATGVWQYFRERIALLPVVGASRPLSNLTQREHEVLALLSRGHPDKDIADRLSISIYTVHEHVRNIFEKLGVHNRTEAVVRFLQK